MQKKIAYGNVYNIGNNKEISIKELISLIKIISGKNKKVVKDENRMRNSSSEVKRLKCDYSAFRKLTKWEPRYSINLGLQKFNDWFLNNRKIYKSNQYNV